MAKGKTVFFCKECGQESHRWLGKCPGCGQWNTFVEERIKEKTDNHIQKTKHAAAVMPLGQISVAAQERTLSGSEELDRVLGGGFIPGSFLLLSGDPGIGKSTLVLQVADYLARSQKVLYVSGEESARQIRLRAERLGLAASPLHVFTETSLERIREEALNGDYEVIFIDSIQTMFLEDMDSAPGSISQVREGAAFLLKLAKEREITVLLVGHVTKDGAVAGPRVLEHMVDTVLYFEGDRHHIFRLLRAVKNRFGPANEIGVFEMRGDGLAEVANPSALFMGEKEGTMPGSSVAVTMEGTRPILIEVQALVTSNSYGQPRRTVNGVDYHRLLMLLAVLDKQINGSFQNKDVFVNVAGGLMVDEPAVDLAVVAALISALKDISLGTTAFIGEVGLTGEIRGVAHIEQRIREAAKFGFTSCVIPAINQKGLSKTDCRLYGAKKMRDILEMIG